MGHVLRSLLGAITLTLITLNTLLLAIATLAGGLIVWCFQWCKPVYACLFRWLHYIPTFWAWLNLCFMKITTHGKWHIRGNAMLSTKASYMLISNHQSWSDILILNCAFAGKIPILKFFIKKELMWSLPIAGLACYFLGFPFMERHTRADIRKNPALKGKDIETAKAACAKFRLTPTTVINFLEGTRFTPEKHEKQHSPYQHLLKPKAGGVAIVINEMPNLAGILDVTINYAADHEISFWDFMCGRLDQIDVHYTLRPIPKALLGDYYQDRNYRATFQRWLNNIWEEKDQILTELAHDKNP